MVTIPNLAASTIINSLSDALNTIESKRTREREYMLDYYEGMNIDDYVKNFFGTETLNQVPIFSQNLTRRICKVRSMTYKRPPKVSADSRYLDHIDIEDLNSSRRQLEQLTFLLGTMAMRCRWSEKEQKIKYDLLSFFEPLFLAGEKEPVGIMYAIENRGKSKTEKPWFAVWTEDRPGMPGTHFLIDQNGTKQSVNDGDINPYGIVPVIYTHRYKPIRDWWSEGASDVIRADLSVSVATTELALAIRFGAIGIKFITGVDDASRIQIGTDKILYLPEGSTFGVTAPSGSLSEIIDATRFLVEATLNNNHIRIKWADVKGNAPSGFSLQVQEIENYDERLANTEDTWRPFEKHRYLVDREIIRVRAGVQLPENYSVDFLEPNYPMSVQDEINHWSWKFENGLATPMDYFDYMNPDADMKLRNEFKKQAEESNKPAVGRLLSRLQSN
jgi:hypothetical protein